MRMRMMMTVDEVYAAVVQLSPLTIKSNMFAQRYVNDTLVGLLRRPDGGCNDILFAPDCDKAIVAEADPFDPYEDIYVVENIDMKFSMNDGNISSSPSSNSSIHVKQSRLDDVWAERMLSAEEGDAGADNGLQEHWHGRGRNRGGDGYETEIVVSRTLCVR